MEKKKLEYTLNKIFALKLRGMAQIINRILMYCLGMFTVAMGVTFSVTSNLGVSPVNSFPYIVSQISNIDLGTCSIMIFSCYVLMQVIILRKDFKIKNLFQIAFSWMFGFFINVTQYIFGGIVFPFGYAGRLLMMLVSIFFIAFGLIMLLSANIVPMPAEGLMLAICEKQKKFSFAQVKIAFDVITVLIAVLLSVIFFGKIDGVREGTAIAAIGVGKMIQFLDKPMNLAINKYIYKKA